LVCVWLPGQWTPIHDHGTWGVVGVVAGTLKESSFIRIDDKSYDAMEDLNLVAGNLTLLTPGAVTSFVPNPDHIHKTGNPDLEKKVVSLHFYGRAMSGYHEYNLETKSRKWIEVETNLVNQT